MGNPHSIQTQKPSLYRFDFTGDSNQNSPAAGLTEILLSNFNNNNFEMLLPMLAYLNTASDHNRWFTWIAPDNINKHLLESYNFNTANIRLIHTSSNKETLWTFWEALNNGNSSVVVATCNSLSKRRFHELNRAAMNGDSRGLALCCA